MPATYAAKARERIHAGSIEDANGCWIWQRALDKSGYGKFKVSIAGSVTITGSHRAAWLAFMGSIPEALQIDHLCRVRACCNPQHMELVTASENTIRSDHSNKLGKGRKGRHLHSCTKHGREEGTLRTRRNGYLYWDCGICTRRRVNAFNARKRALELAA